ncbi:HD-GYP domain-containing protein [Chungangia koreensis]|uniref:HD-GYP domain-containing protein n=1 Tax=Chungangia koreensis TaxID=752657 RepID=A0ABV8X3E0_9LACT
MNIAPDQIRNIKSNTALDRVHMGHTEIIYFKKENGLSYALCTLFENSKLWIQSSNNGKDGFVETYKILQGRVNVEYKGETHEFSEGNILDVADHDDTFTLYGNTETDILITMSKDEFESSFFATRLLQKEAEAIEEVDGYTYMHCHRIKEYSIELYKRMKLPAEGIGILNWGAYFHDIGKLAIPYQILNKKAKLTSEEWEIMKSHTTVGAWMMRNHEISWLKKSAFIVEQHHERFDGNGYPYGLKGDDISIEASIVSVVDSFDAMTTDRIYRDALSIQTAISELEKGRGTQFHPEVVTAFLSMLEEQDFKWR